MDTNGVFHGFVLAPATTATPTFESGGRHLRIVADGDHLRRCGWTTMYYTTNGSTPAPASTVYGGTITVSAPRKRSRPLPAANDFANSAVASTTYTISTIPSSGDANPFTHGWNIHLVANHDNLRHRRRGPRSFTQPTGRRLPRHPLCSAALITVSSTETIEAIAASSGFCNSAVATAAYTINTPAPDFTLTISPATIRYRVCGSKWASGIHGHA